MASVIRGSGASTLGGNVDVQGVLTYEDVTSVDSVGIVTARSGIVIDTQDTSATSLSIGSKGGGSNDGHLEGEGPKINFLATRGNDGATGSAAYIQQKAIGDLGSSYPVDLAFGVRRFGSSFEAMRIASTGRVGIGSEIPTAALDVLSTAYPTVEITRDHDINYPRLRIVNAATDGADLDGLGDGTGGFRISCVAAGVSTERLRINSKGQMILGTASNLGTVPPKLTIINNTNSSTFSECQLLRLNGPSGVGERGGIGFHYAQSSDYGEKPSSFIGVETVAVGGAQQTDLLFATRPNTADNEPTERLRITSAGLVGIGTTNPSTLLHLLGEDSYLMMQSSSASGNAGILFKDSSGTQNGVIFYDFDNDFLKFSTNNDTEALRITSVGQIQHQASGGDNQFISKRTDAAGSNGNYFFHLRAQNNTPVDVGSLGFHRDTASDDSRFVISTRNTGGSNTERLRINSNGEIIATNAFKYVDDIDNQNYRGTLTFSVRAQSNQSNKTIATLSNLNSQTMAIAKITWVGVYAYSGSNLGGGECYAFTRRTNNNSAWAANNDNWTFHEQNGSVTKPTVEWNSGVLQYDYGSNQEGELRIEITYRHCIVTPNV